MISWSDYEGNIIVSNALRIMKALALGLKVCGFVVFAIFSYVQYNDTDPAVYHEPSARDAWMWLIFYGLVSVICLVAVFRPVPRVALIVAALFCSVLMALTVSGLYENVTGQDDFTLTGSKMAPSRSHVELSREFLGAAIALVAVIFLRWQGDRSSASIKAEP